MKAVNSAIEEVAVSVEPDADTQALAREVWHDLLASEVERARVSNTIAAVVGPWWHIRWRNGRLVLQRKPMPPAATTSVKRSPGGPNLGSATVICDGKCLWSDRDPDSDNLSDDLAFVMAKIAKSLNWLKVAVHGSARFQNKFRSRALHETDLYTWALETARSLKEQRPANIDWESIAEELEDLGISQEGALQSHLRVLLAHLLGWAYEPKRRTKSWEVSIKNNRDEIREILDRSPGLRRKIPSASSSAYRKARRDAAGETERNEDAFPPTLAWSYDQITDEGFWPDASN
jgi:Domain of unknown function DUF29